MHREDNNGFINFPINQHFDRKRGKTYVYLIAFDGDKDYELSNVFIDCPGNQLADDITADWFDVNDEEEGSSNEVKNLVTAICIGWNENVHIIKDEQVNWFASFKDLTHEGRKLYYSIKKLHNNKEVRILTIIKIN